MLNCPMNESRHKGWHRKGTNFYTMSKIEENEHIKKQLEGEDFTLKVDGEFRERLINELRHFPNIFLIAGDAQGSTYTVQGDNEELARGIIHILKSEPKIAEWFRQILQHV